MLVMVAPSDGGAGNIYLLNLISEVLGFSHFCASWPTQHDTPGFFFSLEITVRAHSSIDPEIGPDFHGNNLLGFTPKALAIP